MITLKQFYKITGHFLFVIVFIFFSTLEAKNLDKFNKADNIADYFSGILLLNQSKYEESYKYLKKLDGLEKKHITYSSKYLFSLINSGNFNQAFNFSKKLEKNNQDIFESNLIMGIYYLNNSKSELSKKYFSKAKKIKSRTILDYFVIESLYVWSNLNNNFDDGIVNLSKIDNI